MGRRVSISIVRVTICEANHNPNGPEFRRPQAARLAKRAGVARRATPAFLVIYLTYLPPSNYSLDYPMIV